MPEPLALSDEQLTVIQQAAEPLQPHDRGAYLQRVAALLNGHELGDGAVARAAAQAQQEFRRAAAFAPLPKPTRWARSG